ncbi:MAG: cysteine methyltransferase [Chloroflexi bacterium HGW-Chloroflexi-1]|nr:MAG: cysteine methyltransferase [Chloroflexi bacterium HGW-Chloroflexi-1]
MTDDLRALIFHVGTPDNSFEPDWGWIGLVASARGLRLLRLPEASFDAAQRYVHEYYPNVPLIPADPGLLNVADQVRAYLAGAASEFSVELDLRGYTPFALSVWAAAARIPYGQTRTYGWIADQVSGAGAAQAVGAALDANPVPLIIPCHRVIGSDGSLHGFAGGLDMKARLLALESGQQRLNLDAG